MNVSPNFSPPIRVMAPYFLLSALFYTLSIISLFFIEIDTTLTDFKLIAWVHLYMFIGGIVLLSVASFIFLVIIIKLLKLKI